MRLLSILCSGALGSFVSFVSIVVNQDNGPGSLRFCNMLLVGRQTVCYMPNAVNLPDSSAESSGRAHQRYAARLATNSGTEASTSIT